MLAIIIPTYDNLPMLKILVKQIFDFTNGDFKVYIIEDGQKKETVSWLKKQKKITKIYHKENTGIATSWNEGIRKGIEDGCSYFAIFNDDIELCPDWWIKCREPFDRVDVVSIPPGLQFQPTPRVLPIAGWFFILSKNCIEKVGFFDEKIGKFLYEDTDYAIRCGMKNIRCGTVDIPIKHYGSASLNKVKKSNSNVYDNIQSEGYRYLRKKYPYLRMMV
jgi:GT2 family glycosyltransferase